MFCENCGTQLPDNEKVCPKCGHVFEETEPIAQERPAPETPVPPVYANAAAATAAPVKKPVNKLVIIIACAAVGVILLVVLLIALIGSFSGSVYKPLNDGAYIISTSDTIMLLNGSEKITDLDYNGRIFRNYNGTTFVYCSDGYREDREAEIYTVNGKNLKKIASGNITFFRGASYSNTICYLKDDDLCVNNNGSEKKISFIEDELTSLAISPDGSAIAWTVRTPAEYDNYGEEISGEKYHTYAYNGGKEVQIANFTSVYSVSAGGKTIYGTTKRNNVAQGKVSICRDMKDESEPIKDLDDFVAVSADGTQILFKSPTTKSNKTVTYLFDASLKEPIEVYNGELMLAVPDGSYYSPNRFDSFLGVSKGVLYNFTRKGDKYETFRVLTSNEYKTATLSPDGRSVMYLNKNKICKKDTTKDGAEPVVMAEKVFTDAGYITIASKTTGAYLNIPFGTDSNITGAYFIDANGDLKYTSGNPEKTVKIASEVVSLNDYYYTAIISVSDDGVCTFVYNDMIYYSKNGSEKQKVKGPNDVEKFYGKIIVDGEGEIWVSEDGINYVDTKTESDGINITR